MSDKRRKYLVGFWILSVLAVFIFIPKLSANQLWADETETEVEVKNLPPTFFVAPTEDPVSDLDNPTNVGGEILFKAIGLDSNNDNYYMLICNTNSVDFNGSGRFSCSEKTWCETDMVPSSVQATCSYRTSADNSVAERWYSYVCDFQACSTSNQGLGASGSPFIVSERPVVIVPPAGGTTGGTDGSITSSDGIVNLIGGLSRTVIENSERIQEYLDERISEIGVEKVALVTAGTSVASAGAGLLVIQSSFMDLPFFLVNSFLNFLALIGLRKKGRPYGYVFDSVTKEPLSLAIVRTYDFNNKLIRTDVTNSFGIFNSELAPGKYQLTAIKPGYNFPSRILKGNVDFPIENLYYGGELNVKDSGEVKVSIPLDPKNPERIKLIEAVTIYRLRALFKVIHAMLLTAGGFMAGYLFYRYGGLSHGFLFLVYIITSTLFVRVLSAKPQGYGTTYDTEGKPLSGVVLGVRELEFKKLIEKRVSNARGMYRFILPPGKYQLELMNKGIIVTDKRKPVLRFDSKNKKDLVFIAEDMTVVKNL